LLSEGQIDRIVTITRPGARPVSERIRRNGPIALVVTSARPNIEEELLTRLMSSDADESNRQTFKVLRSILAKEESDIGPEEVGRWLDYQRWIQLDAPYDVVLPFRRAMWLAFVRHWRAMQRRDEKFKLRIRRDSHGFQSAIRASAVLHKAQREKDAKRRIMATIDDYGHAHEAFDAGLASLHQVKTPETLLAVVKAVEGMNASDIFGVEVSIRALMDKLGIAGFGTARERLREAVARGLLVPVAANYGLTSARSYTIGKSSKEIEKEIADNPLGNVFPTREMVEKAISDLHRKSAKSARREENKDVTARAWI
jgi:hypothetical protein